VWLVTKRSILVLHDQLTRDHGPLAQARPGDTRIVIAEPRWWLSAPGTHAQKIVTYIAAVRHFATSLASNGFEVDLVRHDDARCTDLATVVATHLARYRPSTFEAIDPHQSDDRREIERGASGTTVRWHGDPMWISSHDAYDAWARGKSSLRMEGFYRTVRRSTGWLMEGDRPVGGRWNFDADNRRPPSNAVRPPPAPATEPDDVTLGVLAEAKRAFPDAWGAWEPFQWPVTRNAATTWLENFMVSRLALFGTYQDAMKVQHPWMWHSGLSVPLNMGLLHPTEVVEAALDRYDDGRGDVPLNAVEGFVRQVAGWREFVWHVYRTEAASLKSANALSADAPLPPAFWGAPTDMACLSHAVRNLSDRGYVHHIQRLMVLGNVAQLVGVEPRAVLDWFTVTHVDALDWVMVPNVMGMSQYADGGRMTSKPYAAGANYVNRMSDACLECRFDPKGGAADDGCPLTPWYWRFVDQHHEALRKNQRTGVIASAWSRRADEERSALLDKAERDRIALLDGRL
jgi:deoxyribodipyrimidine photolyase-related protein